MFPAAHCCNPGSYAGSTSADYSKEPLLRKGQRHGGHTIMSMFVMPRLPIYMRNKLNIPLTRRVTKLLFVRHLSCRSCEYTACSICMLASRNIDLS